VLVKVKIGCILRIGFWKDG